MYRALALAALLLALPACTRAPDATAAWITFRDRFVQADGRLADPARDGMSHSEGQGFAMLLAEFHGDRPTFDRAWRWTRDHLGVREDGLLAWSWVPGQGVTDPNNASDGDILVAWALLRAGERWQDPALTHSGIELARAVRTHLLRDLPPGTILLPGREGFERADGTVINLSYWVYPALDAFAKADPAPAWDALRTTGLALLGRARHGRWGLPADWTLLQETPVPAPGFPARFGYDALRIPLYLAWSGADTPDLMAPFNDYWRYFEGARFLPAWTRFEDDSVDSHDAAPGIHAVAALTRATAGRRGQRPPGYRADDGYYSLALWLLADVARTEAPR